MQIPSCNRRSSPSGGSTREASPSHPQYLSAPRPLTFLRSWYLLSASICGVPSDTIRALIFRTGRLELRFRLTERSTLRGLFYGDALGEVAWLVHVEAAVLGDAVGEELQWYAEHERIQHLWRVGDREHDAGNPTGGLVVLAGYR